MDRSLKRAAAALAAAAAFAGLAVQAQQAPALPPVTISAKANADPVEKSYRRMVRGLELFEQRRAMAPNASLRFKLLPRKRDTSLDQLELYVLGSTVEIPIPVAPDRTFALERHQKALDEDAVVSSDRKARSMTWRTDIRTPGLPPGTRRLGDLRLECLVGMEAGLFSSSPSFITRLVSALSTTPAYCSRQDNRYYFFAERPLFGVTLVAGTRRQMLPAGRLWGGAIDDPAFRSELQYCDCEVLLDRTYFLPLEDASWPDDTLIEFDYMDDPATSVAGGQGKDQVAAQRGAAEAIRFDSGHEVWVYRAKDPRARASQPETVFLFDPAGLVKKVRARPPPVSS